MICAAHPRRTNNPREKRGEGPRYRNTGVSRKSGVFMTLDPIEQPFDSIESAYDFMDLLAQTILDNMKELHRDFTIATQEGQERRARAIELAIFKCKALNCHVHRSRRTLNDLRTIRWLILNERMAPAAVLARQQNE